MEAKLQALMECYEELERVERARQEEEQAAGKENGQQSKDPNEDEDDDDEDQLALESLITDVDREVEEAMMRGGANFKHDMDDTPLARKFTGGASFLVARPSEVPPYEYDYDMKEPLEAKRARLAKDRATIRSRDLLPPSVYEPPPIRPIGIRPVNISELVAKISGETYVKPQIPERLKKSLRMARKQCRLFNRLNGTDMLPEDFGVD